MSTRTLPLVVLGASVLAAITLASCTTAADTASRNLSTDAEQFRIERRIVFFNGITDKYLLEIQGRCSVEPIEGRLEVVCKTGDKKYEKHHLGLSDNVSYFSEQIETADVDEYRTKILFRPETIIPDVDLETSADVEGDGEG